MDVSVNVDVLKCIMEMQKLNSIKKIVESYVLDDSVKVAAIKEICRDAGA